MSASGDRQQYNRNQGDRTEAVKKHKCFCLLSNIIVVRNTIQWVEYVERGEGNRKVYNILARGTQKRSLGESWPINRIISFKQIHK
jgi:hypothetical protein